MVPPQLFELVSVESDAAGFEHRLERVPTRLTRSFFSRMHSLKILYEDNHLIAVYKPPGLSTQGENRGDESLLALTKGWLKEKYQKPGNVFLGLLHRLDKPVAGVVIFAKTSKAASRVSAMIRERTVSKTYEVVVEGKGPLPSGRLEGYLVWDDGARRAFVGTEKSPGAQDVALEYRLLERIGMRSHLEVSLITGRKHQIRAQFSAMGLPVVGDTKYGSTASFPDKRIALESVRMEIEHPVRPGERLAIETERPSPFLKGVLRAD